MSSLFRLPLLLVFLSVLTACSVGTRPNWVDGTDENYPAAKYLIGHGQGPTAEQAQDRARADLAKTLEVSVRVESQDTQRHASGTGYESQVSRVTATATDKVIEGIQIVERWHDEKNQTYYALAVLERLPAQMRLREEIDRIDQGIRTYIGEAQKQTDPLMQALEASRAVVLSRDRDAVQKSLRVVDTTGRGIEPKWSSAQLNAYLDALFKRINMTTRANGEPAFASILAASVASAGFTPATERGDNFVLEGDLFMHETVFQEGWHWARGALTVRLVDRFDRVRGHQSWNIKAAGQSPAAARQRVLDQAGKMLKTDLKRVLIGFATR